MKAAQILFGFIATALTVGCGQGTPMATLSGAVNATFPVHGYAFLTEGASHVEFAIDNLDASGPLFAFVTIFSGTSLRTGTFSQSGADSIGAGAEVAASSDEDAPTWRLDATNGTFSLTISSVGSSGTGGSTWDGPNGALTATLLPSYGNPSTVNVAVNASF